MEQKPANTGLRSQYSLRLYSWAKKYVEEGSQPISLEELRRVFGLESVKDAEGNIKARTKACCRAILRFLRSYLRSFETSMKRQSVGM